MGGIGAHASSPVALMPFILSTGTEKPGPTVRRSIRSHVMMGKNRGKTRPDKKRTKARVTRTQDQHPHQDQDQDLDLSEQSDATTKSLSPSGPSVPRMLAPDVTTIRLASYAEPRLVHGVLQFSSMARKILFPLEACMLFDNRDEAWVQPLAWDPAYLHAMVFTTQDYFASLSASISPDSRQQTLSHCLTTLRLLRERFSDDDQQVLSDSTVAAVLALAAHAHFVGDSRSARHHLDGLHRIVNLKGGTSAFRGNPKLLVEILRCDLGVALDSDSVTLFFNPSHTLGSFIPYPGAVLPRSLALLNTAASTSSRLDLDDLAGNIDGELAWAWSVMSDFCVLSNLAASSSYRITLSEFVGVMTSVTYRLLHMHFESTCNNEAIRLGLLAFSSSIFLQWRKLGLGYSSLGSSYRQCLLTFSPSAVHARLWLWLLMVGSVSLFGKADLDWMRPLLMEGMEECNVRSWAEMQHVLGSVMWVGSVHNGPGKTVFEFVDCY